SSRSPRSPFRMSAGIKGGLPEPRPWMSFEPMGRPVDPIDSADIAPGWRAGGRRPARAPGSGADRAWYLARDGWSRKRADGGRRAAPSPGARARLPGADPGLSTGQAPRGHRHREGELEVLLPVGNLAPPLAPSLASADVRILAFLSPLGEVHWRRDGSARSHDGRLSTGALRQVLPPPAARPRRDGGDLPRQDGGRGRLREGAGRQAHPADALLGSAVHPDADQRGEADGGADPPDHRPDLRARRGGRPLLHLDGVRGGRHPPRGDAPRPSRRPTA